MSIQGDTLVKDKAPQPGTAPFVHESVLGLLRGKSGKILDAGAGRGILSMKLKAVGFEVWASDIDPSWFKVKDIACSKLDLNQALPYQDRFFDCVCCIETIEHLWNPWGAVKEFYRILKPGGFLIVTTPNILSIFSRIYYLVSGRFIHFGRLNFEVLGHISPVTTWQFEGILQKIGFKNTKITFNAGWIPLLEVRIPIKNIFTGNIAIASCQRL